MRAPNLLGTGHVQRPRGRKKYQGGGPERRSEWAEHRGHRRGDEK